MDTGGLSPEERQRQTAAEIARRKVLAAYSQTQQPVSPAQQNPVVQTAQNTQTYKTSDPSLATKKQAQSWEQYHTAWQNYYQKYYGEYYAKAAQKYVEGEKSKLSAEVAKEKEAMQKLLQQKAAEQKQQGALAQAIISSDEKTDEDASKSVEMTLRERIQKKANSKFKVKKKHKKWIPIVAGVMVTLFVLFLQYNREVFAPIMAYISPGNVSDEEIAAIDPTLTTAPNGESRLIIPKLNVDVPVHFGIANDTATLNNAMNNGVAHFRIPGAQAFPGEVGNVVISGHSAGDIYSNNQYKFIFSGLERLVEGDLIYINYNSVRYTYKMVGRSTVSPNDVNALVYNGNKNMLTLLTCWPTGTTQYRLLISAEQVNPTPASSGDAVIDPGGIDQPEEMPSNDPTFFENIWNWIMGH